MSETESSPSSSTSPSAAELVPAELSDFYPGSEIFIRSQVARCLRFDYPHVYWKFPDSPEDIEKHRSFTASPQIFSVDPKYRASRPSRAGASDSAEPPPLIDDEQGNADFPSPPVAVDESSEIYQNRQSATKNNNTMTTAAAASASDESAKNSNPLLAMFQRRPPRAVYDNVDSSPATSVEAKFPQSVHIENSHRSVFNIPHKITSLTILKCSELTINFNSVISNVELIRSPSILLNCHGQVSTWNLDHSNECEIQFISNLNSNVQIITTNSSGCEVIVKSNAGTNSNDEEEKRYLIEDAGVQRISTEDHNNNEIPIPNDIIQYKTEFKDGEFLTKRLEREGPLGYFNNNSS